MRHFIFCLALFSIFDLLHAQNVHLPNTQGFHMVEKSGPQWVTVGQTIRLTCKTSSSWNLCRWILPSEHICDRRIDELYDVSCNHNSRVKFQVTLFCLHILIFCPFWSIKISQSFFYPIEVEFDFASFSHIQRVRKCCTDSSGKTA